MRIAWDPTTPPAWQLSLTPNGRGALGYFWRAQQSSGATGVVKKKEVQIQKDHYGQEIKAEGLRWAELRTLRWSFISMDGVSLAYKALIGLDG